MEAVLWAITFTVTLQFWMSSPTTYIPLDPKQKDGPISYAWNANFSEFFILLE